MSRFELASAGKGKFAEAVELYPLQTKGISGTGLGLWISEDIMHRHGGKISIRSSQREGHRGTVVTLFLPFNNPVAAGG